MQGLELWGGHECTVNRVRGRYVDQSVVSGHDSRLSDLELFASLGLKSLRYPVLWEKVSPERPDEQDFRLADERLPQIARLGMRPIVGLIHHGSGPRRTSLLDDDGFATGLAAHAAATAQRFPWVCDWTPVNEPLTTARFSALYGIWYPHTSNEGAFWRALLNEIDATRLSMREIRRVNPEARLVQTEDLGYCHATPPMQAQADYENERRWITWDLLCGAVRPGHPLWSRLCAWGLEDRLRAIADDPCPPDILGLNHYLSSERLLDHRVELYPPGLLGGDGPGAYVNIEAVRTVRDGTLGVGALLRQTWERYGRTIAITECHNGCTREEQMRWFHEVWRAAEAARAGGVDLRAVTAWSLLGAYDWNRLLAEQTGHYEPGVFDLRDGQPRPTAMVDLLKALANGREPEHPALGGQGWWRRPDRLYSQAVELGARPEPAADASAPPCRPILIAGPPGPRTAALADACDLRGLAYVTLEVGSCGEAGLQARVEAALRESEAWAVVHIAAAETSCRAVTSAAGACGARGAVWRAGAIGDVALPAGWMLVDCGPLISRSELGSFAAYAIETLEAGRPFRAASNRFAPGGCLSDAAHALLDLLVDGAQGTIRLETEAAPSWAELAAQIARIAGLDAFLVEPVLVPSLRRAPAAVQEPSATDASRRLPDLASAAAAVVAAHRIAVAGRNVCGVAEEPGSAELRHAAE